MKELKDYSGSNHYANTHGLAMILVDIRNILEEIRLKIK